MTDSYHPGHRRLACARCGTEFSCQLGGGCWCAGESYRLKVPAPGSADCLCRDCLRAEAARQAGASEHR